jgi:hypothetical protein
MPSKMCAAKAVNFQLPSTPVVALILLVELESPGAARVAGLVRMADHFCQLSGRPVR